MTSDVKKDESRAMSFAQSLRISKLDELSSAKPKTWADLIDTEIYTKSKKSFLLLRVIGQKIISKKKLVEYFQDEGVKIPPVIIDIKDGMLVSFQSDEEAWPFRSGSGIIQVDDVKLQVFPKDVPPLHENAFIVKVEDCNESDLKAYFKHFHQKNQPQPVIQSLPQKDCFSVTYKSEAADVSKIKKSLKKIPCNGKHLMVKPFCRTDCIRVTKLKDDTTDDEIREGCKKHGQYRITHVEKATKKPAFLYFADYEDAEDLIKKTSATSKIKVGVFDANVSLYYHPETVSETPEAASTSIRQSSTRRMAAQFPFQPSTLAAAKSSTSSTGLRREMYRCCGLLGVRTFRHLAIENIRFEAISVHNAYSFATITRFPGVMVKATSPSSNGQETNAQQDNTEEFRARSDGGDGDGATELFLIPCVPQGIVEFVRLLPEPNDFLMKKFEREGTASLVSKETLIADENAFHYVVQLELSRFGQIAFEIDGMNGQRFAAVLQERLDKFFEQFSSESESFDCNRLKSLRSNFGWDRDDADLIAVEIDTDKLVQVHVRWHDETQGRVTVSGYTLQVQEVLKKLKDNVAKQEIPSYSDGHQRKWQNYQKREPLVVEHSLDLSRSVIRHIDALCNESKEWKVMSSAVQCAPNESYTGFKVKGQLKAVAKAMQWLEAESMKLVTIRHDVDDSSLCEFLRGEKIAKIVSEVEQETKCFIEIETTEPNDEWGGNRMLEPRQSSAIVQAKRKLRGCDVNVQIVQTDVTQHRCDAIVNETNEELELGFTGVSQRILLEDIGRSISRSMTDYKRKYGNLMTGEAMTTTAGNLKYCKKVIHAVGPTWHTGSWQQNNFQQSCQDLQRCVTQCLLQAEKHNLSSIAVPAISRGMFGDDVETCTSLIVTAIDDCFRNTRESQIKRIDLVELSDQKTLMCFEKALVKISKASTDQHYEDQLKPLSSPALSRSGQIGSIQVIVKQGDITKEHTDMIINPTGPSCDLTVGQVSKAVAAQGGRSIIDECLQNRDLTTSPPEFIVTTGGKLACKKVLHIPIEYNARPEKFFPKLEKAFIEGDKLRMRSMALPAIGTGTLGIGARKCAKETHTAIENVAKKSLKFLREIRIVLFDRALVETFQEEILKNSSRTAEPSPYESALERPPWPTELEARSHSSSVDRVRKPNDVERGVMTVVLCSAHERRNQEAWDSLLQRADEGVAGKKLSELLEIPWQQLLDHHKELLDLQQEFQVQVEMLFTKYQSKFIIHGTKDDVFRACSKAKILLQMETPINDVVQAGVNLQPSNGSPPPTNIDSAPIQQHDNRIYKNPLMPPYARTGTMRFEPNSPAQPSSNIPVRAPRSYRRDIFNNKIAENSRSSENPADNCTTATDIAVPDVKTRSEQGPPQPAMRKEFLRRKSSQSQSLAAADHDLNSKREESFTPRREISDEDWQKRWWKLNTPEMKIDSIVSDHEKCEKILSRFTAHGGFDFEAKKNAVAKQEIPSYSGFQQRKWQNHQEREPPVVEHSLDLCRPVIRHIDALCQESEEWKVMSSAVQCAPNESYTSFKMKGRLKAVAEAMQWLEAESMKLVTTRHDVDDPSLCEFLRGEKIAKIVSEIEQETKCFIEIETTELNDEWIGNRMLEPRQSGAKVRANRKLRGCDVNVQVVETDITQHQCDAIVNASNEEWELRPAGVSGSILNKDFSGRIQRSMSDYRRKYGKLRAGEAMTTTAGSLKCCKKVIHAVGPTWYTSSWQQSSSTSSRDLQRCVKQCLLQAEKHNLSSIAIPAISCGVFGGDVETCTLLIVGAIDDYFRNTKKSRVTRIDLVELTDQKTLMCFEKALVKLSAPSTDQRYNGQLPPVRHQPVVSQPKRQASTASSRSGQIGSIHVIVKQGDITKENADMIINPTGLRYDLTAGQVSKALVAQGGRSIIDECLHKRDRWFNLSSPREFIVTTGGRLECQKIIHMPIEYPPRPEKFFPKLEKMFKEGDKNRMRSMALPAIGTGTLGIDARKCATMTLGAIEKVARASLKHLHEIRVVLYDRALVETFQKEILKNSSRKVQSSSYESALERPPWPTGLETQGRSSSVDRVRRPGDVESGVITVVLCSAGERRNQEAWDSLLQRVLEGGAGKPFRQTFDVSWQQIVDRRNELLDLDQEFKVPVKITTSRDQNKCVIHGAKDDVFRACSKARILLQMETPINDENKQRGSQVATSIVSNAREPHGDGESMEENFEDAQSSWPVGGDDSEHRGRSFGLGSSNSAVDNRSRATTYDESAPLQLHHTQSSSSAPHTMHHHEQMVVDRSSEPDYNRQGADDHDG